MKRSATWAAGFGGAAILGAAVAAPYSGEGLDQYGTVAIPPAAPTQTANAQPIGTTANDGGLTATAVSAVERMPRDADSSNTAAWWVPLAYRNGVSYFAFDAPGSTAERHEVKVGKRDAAGTWTFGVLKNADGTTWSDDDDPGHNQPTIAVDGDGYIHVWADLHGDDWRYFRSSSAGDVSDLRRRSEMPGSGSFTYPVAKTAPNGDVWLFLRNRASTSGTGELYRFANASRTWSRISGFAYSAGAVVYPDDLVFGSDGSLHIVWEWAKTSPRSLRHYGSYLRYVPSTNRWYYMDGTQATVPVSLTSSSKLFYLPLQSGEAFVEDETVKGLQSAKIALDPNDRPTIAYRFRPTDGSGTQNFDVWRVRWDGGAWVNREKIYAANNDVPAALGLTRNATSVRVYFTTTGGGLQRAVKTGTTDWTITALAPGKAIFRTNVTPIDGDTDVVYGGAPTDVNSTTGSVYWLTASD